VTNTLAYYDTEIITAVKSFMVQAVGINILKKLPIFFTHAAQNKLERLFVETQF
jgi:hypothetical protein